jgi:hypothetical protein
MRLERNISTVDAPTEVIEVPADARALTGDPYAAPVVAVEPVVVPERHVQTVRVASDTTIMPAAAVAGVLSVLLLIFGGVAMARAGFDGPLDEPVVSVGGFTATAVLGMFAAGSGFALLCAALARARSAILLFAIIIGIVAVIAAIEPTLGNGALAIERSFAVLTALGAGIVILAATLVPTMRRTATHVERT